MITVYDGGRQIKFEGTLLGSATSDDGRVQRWTEQELYRTDGGRYVLHNIGCSVVYHELDAKCSRLAVTRMVSALKDEDLKPCVRCGPPDIYSPLTPRSTMIAIERDVHSTVISEKAAGIVEALHLKDHNGKLFLTKLAKRLIYEAAKNDKELEKAWLVQTV